MANVTKRVKFYGRVQGVNFRRNTRDAAENFDVYGWVMNMPDGTVEAEISGEERKVDALISFCRSRMSPARVDRIDEDTVEYRYHDGFRIKY